MHPGDLVPSERELTELFGVSRTTVRLALEELANRGIVERVHGRGTFVTDRSSSTTNLAHEYSFTEQMREMGRVPTTDILSFGIVKPHGAPVASLQLADGENVYVIRRLRRADGVPMMVETTYLPVSKFIGLTREQLTSMPMYDLFDKVYGQTILLAEEDFSAGLASADDAKLLGISGGSAILRLKRETYNVQHEPIEYTQSVARGDQFHYQIRHLHQQ